MGWDTPLVKLVAAADELPASVLAALRPFMISQSKLWKSQVKTGVNSLGECLIPITQSRSFDEGVNRKLTSFVPAPRL
jgi:hypothetical protein